MKLIKFKTRNFCNPFILVTLLFWVSNSTFAATICLEKVHSKIALNLINNLRLEPDTGKKILEKLKNSLPENSTTASRKEQKSVVSDEVLDNILQDLSKGYTDKEGIFHPVNLASRDKIEPGVISTTVTLYGKKVVFRNQGIDTNFKLRFRYYANLKKNSDGQVAFKRVEQTGEFGWCEIKVKHPSPSQINGVNKYRIKLHDKDIEKLISADVKSKDFPELIKKIKKHAYKIEENDTKQVDAILDTIFEVGRLDAGFIKPKVGITYERTAYKYDEPKNSFYNKIGPVQYQITVDRNVKFFNLENFAKTNQDPLKLENYLLKTENVAGHYPYTSNVVEFKDPFPVANFTKQERSDAHNFFYEKLVEPMFQKILPQFKPNVGKFGHQADFTK
ncbi:MAG: hypothetical protein U0T83_07435 [Bacteriovoracaceae bacterium]